MKPSSRTRWISIHAPLAGCDSTLVENRLEAAGDFNPRTPCGVRRTGVSSAYRDTTFQSTHPLRGATAVPQRRGDRPFDFNPRTPCGVRRVGDMPPRPSRIFQSTHPLRGATLFIYSLHTRRKFQSTHPLRGATRSYPYPAPTPSISIHAPLAGCDKRALSPSARGEQFQSTHPLRGATR